MSSYLNSDSGLKSNMYGVCCTVKYGLFLGSFLEKCTGVIFMPFVCSIVHFCVISWSQFDPGGYLGNYVFIPGLSVSIKVLPWKSCCLCQKIGHHYSPFLTTSGATCGFSS